MILPNSDNVSGKGLHFNDVIIIGLLVVMAAILLPAWPMEESRYMQVSAETPELGPSEHVYNFYQYIRGLLDTMTSSYLLLSLAMLLVIRAGGVDLGVWSSSWLGGVIAVNALNGGGSFALAVVCAAGVGLCVGAGNAVIVGSGMKYISKLRSSAPIRIIYSLVVTGIVSVCVIQLISMLSPAGAAEAGEIIAIPAAFESLQGAGEVNYIGVRILLVSATITAVVVTILNWHVHWRKKRSQQPFEFAPLPERNVKWQMPLALVVAGALAGIAGAGWVIEMGRAPLPSSGRIIGDLRVVAAVVLAGGIGFAMTGAGRTILSILVLPGALLVATIWRQKAWPVGWEGYEIHVAILALLACTCHISALIASKRKTKACTLVALAAMLIVMVAIGLVCTSAHSESFRVKRTLYRYAMGCTCASVGLIVLVMMVGLRKSIAQKMKA